MSRVAVRQVGQVPSCMSKRVRQAWPKQSVTTKQIRRSGSLRHLSKVVKGRLIGDLG